MPKGGKRKVLESPTGWYRVTVSFARKQGIDIVCDCAIILQLPYGNKYEKDYVSKVLLEKIAPLPFIPTMVS